MMIADKEKEIAFIKDLEDYSKTVSSQTPEWINELRNQSFEQFTKQGIPSVKDEEWKYTNITPITERTYTFGTKEDLKAKDRFEQYCSKDDVNVVFINGIFAEELSNIQDLPKGVEISTLQNAVSGNGLNLKPYFQKYTADKQSAFASLNDVLLNDGIIIHAANNVSFDKLIHVVHITNFSGKEIICAPRTLITLGKSSEITVLESHIAFNDDLSYFANPLTDIFLEENATLHYCKAQGESKKSYHIGTTRIWQERNSNLDSFSLMTGGLITRNNIDIVVSGEGSNSTLNGLYSLNDKQHVDNHTSVDHQQPNCTSTQLYKGILNGDSRAVFNGKIFVRAIAQLTNSYQLNKNLLLGKNCRVDTKPQLEIFADDVKCTHGATIGQLNEDELFYLQTRAIPKKEAVKMLARGFVDDILNTIPSESICKKLHILIEPTFAALD